jgi:hypothetical protein
MSKVYVVEKWVKRNEEWEIASVWTSGFELANAISFALKLMGNELLDDNFHIREFEDGTDESTTFEDVGTFVHKMYQET